MTKLIKLTGLNAPETFYINVDDISMVFMDEFLLDEGIVSIKLKSPFKNGNVLINVKESLEQVIDLINSEDTK